MGKMDTSPAAIAPLLLRNLLTSIFIFADKSILSLARQHKLLEILRYLLVSSFLFFLRLLPSLLPSESFPFHKPSTTADDHHRSPVSGVDGDSGVARALSQLLSIVNDIPVSSRKYDGVRSLAEKLIDENNQEGSYALREVNRIVISAAFGRTLSKLESTMLDRRLGASENGGFTFGPGDNKLNRVLRAVRSLGESSLVNKTREGTTQSGNSCAEKHAAELLWLAEKLAACGYVEESCSKWASASNLAWLALSAEPRLQGSLVKVSAFLFTQAKDLVLNNGEEENKKEEERKTKLKMLLSWLPLLCRASNGTDAPIMSMRDRSELEKVLEDTIDLLEQEEQEQVLSLWLHHFTYSPLSDWPNLHASYSRWYNASRKLLVLQ